MKAKELFESENADLPWGSRETLPPAMVVPDMAPYYEFYRFVVSLAGYPEKEDIPMQSVVRDVPIIVPYTKIEHDGVQKMLKKMKKHPIHLTKKPSIEPEFVYKESPVRKFKDYDQ
jgi:hypothetical protein